MDWHLPETHYFLKTTIYWRIKLVFEIMKLFSCQAELVKTTFHNEISSWTFFSIPSLPSRLVTWDKRVDNIFGSDGFLNSNSIWIVSPISALHKIHWHLNKVRFILLFYFLSYIPLQQYPSSQRGCTDCPPPCDVSMSTLMLKLKETDILKHGEDHA